MTAYKYRCSICGAKRALPESRANGLSPAPTVKCNGRCRGATEHNPVAMSDWVIRWIQSQD